MNHVSHLVLCHDTTELFRVLEPVLRQTAPQLFTKERDSCTLSDPDVETPAVLWQQEVDQPEALGKPDVSARSFVTAECKNQLSPQPSSVVVETASPDVLSE